MQTLTVEQYQREQRRRMSEALFQGHVIREALDSGWPYQFIFHDRDSRGNRRGLPDLIMINGTRLLFAELKKVGGSATPEQRAWLDALANVETVESYLWRPTDWDQVVEVLGNGHGAGSTPVSVKRSG